MANNKTQIDFSAFLASMAHDMKNSLGILLHSLDDVVTDCVADQCPCKNHLSKIQYEASRVNHNLIQLLTLYKMDNDQFGLNISHYHVIDVLEETILQNKHLLESRGIEVTIECDVDLTWFFDRDLIAGVVNNVLNNSYRYAKDKITIRADENNGFFELVIEDNGEGYPKEILNKGLDTSRGVNFSTGSTGLGLYFAKMVAQLHKNKGKVGKVAISNGSTHGGGCFTISLP